MTQDSNVTESHHYYDIILFLQMDKGLFRWDHMYYKF